ncbi:MAG: ATP synthase F1 subunit delta [Thermoguttaceae bacterium]
MSESADITARDARTAAQLQADAGLEQIADIYGRALLGATEKGGQTQSVLEDLDGLLDEVFGRFPKLEAILGSVLVSKEEKEAIIDRVFRGKLAPMVLDFLKVLARHGRLDCLRAIQRQARLQYEKLRRQVRVRLITAEPIDDALAEQITQDLRAMLEGEPLLQRSVDPQVIGGAVLYIGDTVYDGSVARQLQSIRQQMIDRSVHEIQSRRDRFCNSAGN